MIWPALLLACTDPAAQLTVDPPLVEYVIDRDEIVCPAPDGDPWHQCFTGTVTLTAHEDGQIVAPYPTSEEAIAQTGATGIRIGSLDGEWSVLAGDTVEADYIVCVVCEPYGEMPSIAVGRPAWALHWSDDGRGGHACLFEATAEVWVVVE